MECTPKLVTKVTVTEKMKSVSLKFSINNDVIKQLFEVLFLVANVRPQPWLPLIDGLVDDAVPHSAMTEMRRCTENHSYSVLLVY